MLELPDSVTFTVGHHSAGAPCLGDGMRRKGIVARSAKAWHALRSPGRNLAAIAAIAERKGVGALLAEGSRRAAIEIGGESMRWAMHVKAWSSPVMTAKLERPWRSAWRSPARRLHHRSALMRLTSPDRSIAAIRLRQGSIVAAPRIRRGARLADCL